MKGNSVKVRNSFAGEKGRRRFGAGPHKDKKKEASKDACRKWRQKDGRV